jgi:hypothetical protein
MPDASTTPPSDEPRHVRSPSSGWPVIPPDHPTAAWHAVAQVKIDGCLEAIERVEYKLDRGGPATKLALACLAAVSTFALAALGPGGVNVKWYVIALVAVVALVWGGTVAFGDWTIGALPPVVVGGAVTPPAPVDQL